MNVLSYLSEDLVTRFPQRLFPTSLKRVQIERNVNNWSLFYFPSHSARNPPLVLSYNAIGRFVPKLQ